jgi:hypothetical protein
MLSWWITSQYPYTIPVDVVSVSFPESNKLLCHFPESRGYLCVPAGATPHMVGTLAKARCRFNLMMRTWRRASCATLHASSRDVCEFPQFTVQRTDALHVREQQVHHACEASNPVPGVTSRSWSSDRYACDSWSRLLATCAPHTNTLQCSDAGIERQLGEGLKQRQDTRAASTDLPAQDKTSGYVSSDGRHAIHGMPACMGRQPEGRRHGHQRPYSLKASSLRAQRQHSWSGVSDTAMLVANLQQPL